MSALPDVLQGQRGAYSITARRPFAYGRICVLFTVKDDQGQDLCVKVFRDYPGQAMAASDLALFQRELNTQSELKHPGILPVLDYGGDTQNAVPPFIVYPMCSGGNLRQFMAHQSFVPVESGIAILEQVAGAVDFAHHSGVIHGDIKPENILFRSSGSHPCLSDFGIVPGAAGSTIYLSPEQIERNDISPRSDLYSLGVVAFELFTGKLPFDTTAPPFKQMKDKVEGRIIDPKDANPALSDSVADALRAAIAYRPGYSDVYRSNSRPSSASAFCLALRGQVPRAGKRDRSVGWWRDLDAAGKAVVVAAIVAAVSGVIVALIKSLPKLLK